jgi:hypothetical protein
MQSASEVTLRAKGLGEHQKQGRFDILASG